MRKADIQKKKKKKQKRKPSHWSKVLSDCVYLQLVELQQVTITRERGQQAPLLRPPLRASSGGGVNLRRNTHTLQREDGVRRVQKQQVNDHNLFAAAHLRVDRRLLILQLCALQVLDLVLLVDLVVSLASCAAGHVIPHAVVSSLLLHARDVGRCKGVKEETKKGPLLG